MSIFDVFSNRNKSNSDFICKIRKDLDKNEVQLKKTDEDIRDTENHLKLEYLKLHEFDSRYEDLKQDFAEAHQTLHTLQQKASLYDQQNSPHRFAVVNSDKNNVPQVFPGRAHTIVDNKDLSDKPEGNFHARQGKK